MLKRKIEERIVKWIDEGKDALLISGARQVGKTYLIQSLLRRSGKDYVEFNLLQRKDVVDLLAQAMNSNINNFLPQLSLLAGRELKKGTIIFFDEVQEYKDILTAIKFFVLDNSFRFIMTGSLLGVELVGLKSAPVGFLTIINMYPLSFEEFAWSQGVPGSLLELLKSHFENKTPVDQVTHNFMIDLFYRYLVIGGMPEAVAAFNDKHDYQSVFVIHQRIHQLYLIDFTKYETQKRYQLRAIYEHLPAELNKKNKRFILSSVDQELKFSRFENNFLWLSDAGVAIPVYNVAAPQVPLLLNKKSSLFKLFMSDIGLLASEFGQATRIALANHDGDVNFGAMFENVIAQELSARGKRIFYYNSKKLGEVDFVIEIDGKVVPVEIKSGGDYKRHAALNSLMSHYLNVDRAIVFSTFNVEVVGKIDYYPIYMVMFLQDSDQEITFSPLEIPASHSLKNN